MPKLSLGKQLFIATAAALALIGWWFAVSGYQGEPAQWVIGLFAIAFSLYSIVLWVQWYRAGGSIMGWRDKHRRKRGDDGSQSQPPRGPRIRIEGGQLGNSRIGFHLGKGSNADLEIRDHQARDVDRYIVDEGDDGTEK
jgi:hypothetical protein